MYYEKDGLRAVLFDDGTLDTVIEVEPINQPGECQQFRFSGEYPVREIDGTLTDESFEELADEAIENYFV